MKEGAQTESYVVEEPTCEELAQIERATSADTMAVDALILSRCTDRWRKVAMVVASSSSEFDTKFPNLPHIYMPLRIIELVKQGVLESRGNMMAMRFSEIRRSTSTD